MNYRLLYGTAIVVTVILAGLASVQASTDLGLTGQQRAILSVITTMLGVANGFLPRVTAKPADDRKGLD